MTDFFIYAIKDKLSKTLVIDSIFVRENDEIALRYFQTLTSNVPEELKNDLFLVKLNGSSLTDYSVIYPKEN